jgi:hypothetical protein
MIERKGKVGAILFDEELELRVGAVLVVSRQLDEQAEILERLGELVRAPRSTEFDCAGAVCLVPAGRRAPRCAPIERMTAGRRPS